MLKSFIKSIGHKSRQNNKRSESPTLAPPLSIKTFTTNNRYKKLVSLGTVTYNCCTPFTRRAIRRELTKHSTESKQPAVSKTSVVNNSNSLDSVHTLNGWKIRECFVFLSAAILAIKYQKYSLELS